MHKVVHKVIHKLIGISFDESFDWFCLRFVLVCSIGGCFAEKLFREKSCARGRFKKKSLIIFIINGVVLDISKLLWIL